MTLFLSAVVLLAFLEYTPEVTIFFRGATERDAAIKEVMSSADVGRLQQTAKMYVDGEYATGTTAKELCYVAIVTLLLISIASIVSLVWLGRIRRELREAGRSSGPLTG